MLTGAMEPEGGDQFTNVNGTMANDSGWKLIANSSRLLTKLPSISTGDLDYEDETGSGEDYVDDVVNVDLVPTDGGRRFDFN